MQMKDFRVIFTVVTLIIGFMLAIQFQSTKEPVLRDTRDVRELRNELRAEQERHQKLTQEIDKQTNLIHQYEESIDSSDETIEDVLIGQIEEMQTQAGLTEVVGEGIVLTIEPIILDHQFGQTRKSVSPRLLRFLVNELNIHQAKEIAIGNQRVVSTTAFRDVNGVTQLNGRRIPPLPLEIRVIAEDAQKLHNEMIVSESVIEFEIENLKITSVPVNELTLPGYDQTLRVRYMEQVKED